MRENKKPGEILRGLQEKHGREYIVEKTIRLWISGMKSLDKERARNWLGRQYMTYWDKLNNKTTNNSNVSGLCRERVTKPIKEFPSLKKACLDYILECLKQNKKNDLEIINDLKQRFSLNSLYINNVASWITALKTSNRDNSNRSLGKNWMEYWHSLHPDSRDESINQVVGSASSVTADSKENHDDLPDIIEIKQESIDGFLKLPIKPNQAGVPKREPHSILGKANFNGKTYFMIKWKGPFPDELGMLNFFIFLIISLI